MPKIHDFSRARRFSGHELKQEECRNSKTMGVWKRRQEIENLRWIWIRTDDDESAEAWGPHDASCRSAFYSRLVEIVRSLVASPCGASLSMPTSKKKKLVLFISAFFFIFMKFLFDRKFVDFG